MAELQFLQGQFERAAVALEVLLFIQNIRNTESSPNLLIVGGLSTA